LHNELRGHHASDENGGTLDPALVLVLFTAIILWGRFGSSQALLGKPSAQAIPATKPVREETIRNLEERKQNGS
jgi:hypothetical protein